MDDKGAPYIITFKITPIAPITLIVFLLMSE